MNPRPRMDAGPLPTHVERRDMRSLLLGIAGALGRPRFLFTLRGTTRRFEGSIAVTRDPVIADVEQALDNLLRKAGLVVGVGSRVVDWVPSVGHGRAG